MICAEALFQLGPLCLTQIVITVAQHTQCFGCRCITLDQCEVQIGKNLTLKRFEKICNVSTMRRS